MSLEDMSFFALLRGTIFYFIAWYCYISCMSTVPGRWAAKIYQVVKSPQAAGKPAGMGGMQAVQVPVQDGGPKGCQKACTVPQMAKLLVCLGRQRALRAWVLRARPLRRRHLLLPGGRRGPTHLVRQLDEMRRRMWPMHPSRA